MRISALLVLNLFFLFACKAQGAWTQKPDFGNGIKRTGAIAFSIGGKGYVGLGNPSLAPAVSSDIWEFDPMTNAWTQKNDFGGGGRTAAVGFSIGGKGYAGSGNNIGGIPQKDFWEFDPIANTWTRVADINWANGVEGAVGFSIGLKGYVGTGYLSNGSAGNLFSEYDPQTNAWTSKAYFGGSARYEAFCFVLSSKAYVGCGFTGSAMKKDVWEYDPASDTWVQKTDFPGVGRYQMAGFPLAIKGYAGLGSSGGTSRYKDFYEYDPSGDQWTAMPDFPGTERDDPFCFSIAATSIVRAYIGTGMIGSTGSYDRLTDMWEFVPSWATNAPMSINNLNNAPVINIFPNPAAEFINVEFENYNRSRILIYNLQGAIVGIHELTESHTVINIEELNVGTYLYVIEAGGEDFSSGKFLVVH